MVRCSRSVADEFIQSFTFLFGHRDRNATQEREAFSFDRVTKPQRQANSFPGRCKVGRVMEEPEIDSWSVMRIR